MSVFEKRSRLAVSAAEASAWYARPGAVERLAVPRMRARPRAARRWAHTHRFEPVGTEACDCVDRVEYAPPLRGLGEALAGRAMRRRLERAFELRHERIADDLIRHGSVRASAPLRVALSGASGLVGRALAPFLAAGGHGIVRLVRRAPRAAEEVGWDPASGLIDARGLEGVDAVVHLAGESLSGGRWTPARKTAIRTSRIERTHLLAAALAGLERRPRVLVSASAIGFYGDRGDETLDETSASGAGFLAQVCREWEAAARPAEEAGIRVVRLRIGVVLAGAGGALPRLALPFRVGLGGRVGDGRQVLSWIGLDDLLGAIHAVLFDESLSGPVNATAPEPARNAELSRVLGRVLRRPVWLPAPAVALRVALGEMADEMLLASARVVPSRLEASGFRFLRPDLEAALRFELGRPTTAAPARL